MIYSCSFDIRIVLTEKSVLMLNHQRFSDFDPNLLFRRKTSLNCDVNFNKNNN